jgi:hypothetical protein
VRALPKHQVQIEEQADTEVIYLLIPPAAASVVVHAPRPYSFFERLALAGENLQLAWYARSNKFLALGISLFLTVAVGYSIYILKSAMGINIFSAQSLESFVPLPGYGR